MANQALIDYIMHQRVHGASTGNIKNALLHAGWEEGDIDKGLKATEKAPNHPPLPPDVIIKPDQIAGAGEVAPIFPAKKSPIAIIILLILGILVVASAAVFVYWKFIRSGQSETATTTAKVVTPPVARTVINTPDVITTTGGDLPIPTNSERGKVQPAAPSSGAVGLPSSN